MSILIPVTIGMVVISIVAKFIGPPLLVTLAPPQPPPRCEGYYPDIEVCLTLGTKRPPWFRRNRSNANCPQWRIYSIWDEREFFTAKLRDIEAVANEWESVLAKMMDTNMIEKCGGVEAVKPPVWIRRERGVAWSRIQDGIIAGNSEYHCDYRSEKDQGGGHGHICWTDALLSMYVEKYGVKTSDDFNAFIINFDISSFRNELQDMKGKCVAYE